VSGSVGVDIQGDFGTLHLNANGTYTYTADPDSVTADSVDHFVYTITDGDGDTSTTTLDITVNNVGLGVSDDEALVNEAGLSTGSNAASDSEIDADGQIVVTGGTSPYTFALDGSATGTHGTLTLNPDGSYTYTLTSPVDGTTLDNGTNTVTNVDSFAYTATDDNGNTVHGTITVDVIDDVPTAHADTNSVGEGGSVNGNVLTDGTDDVLGADGAAPGGAVTGVATGSDTSNPVSGSVGTDIDGAFGTLHLNANGTYTYTADPDSVTSNQVDHFVYTITDGDGDTSTTTLDITVNNVTLVADNDTVTVNEAALDLVADNRTGTLNDDLAAGNVTGTDPTSANETVSGQLAVTGATSYAIVGSSTGNFGQIHINADGSYTYTLTDPVDNLPHANDGHDTEAGAEVFTYEATDANGNTVQGTITVDIVDDAPLNFSPIEAIAENTGSDVVSGHLDVEDTDDSLDDNAGADGIGSLTWNITNGTALLDGDGNPVKVGGQAVLLFVELDGTLTATTDHSSAAATVFTATLDPATSSYEIDFDRVLDNGSTTASDFSSLAAGNTPWKGLDTSVKADGTHPPISEAEVGAANDSTDLLFTGYSGTTSPGSPLITINTDNDDIGTGGGQKINPNEYLRVDMVQDLRRDANSDEKDPGGYTYDTHVGQTHFQFGIIDSQSHGEVDVLIKAFNVNDGSPTALTNVDATAINTQVDIDPASIEVTLNGVPVDPSTYTVIESGLGVYVQGIPEHALIAFQATGGASFEAVTIENANGDQIPGQPAGTVFTGQPFGAGAFTFGVNDAGDPVDFHLPVLMTDGDGDTSTGSIPVTVYPEGQVPAATLAAENSSMQTMSLETTSLMASNDNNGQHTQDVQRVANSGQNVVLMGALAAAGLEAGHGSLTAHALGGVEGGHTLAWEHFQGAAVSGPAIEASHSVGAPHAISAGGLANAVQSMMATTRFHDMGDHQLGVSHGEAKQGAEMTELLQASATPAHGSAQHATAVTAAAVAMPSAEQLVAAAGGNAAAQSQASVAGESAQHTQVVGKVLADALHGGAAHGPNIDALLQAAHGQSPAQDAIEAFASHGGSAVSFGHMAFGTAFAGAHGMLAVEMMHADAAPPAHG